MDVDAAKTIAIENIWILKQAQQLIADLSDEIYVDNDVPPYQSGVGKHVRHVVDFYQAFLGYENGRIDYDLRERSMAIETDRGRAVETIGQIIRSLESIQDADRKVMCKNDDGGRRRPDHAFSVSSIGRELQFLASHSVHHFAIIAILLTQHGYRPPKGFGVAASTLTYWKETGVRQNV